jgi:heme-degrading monooxygenase HmoA
MKWTKGFLKIRQTLNPWSERDLLIFLPNNHSMTEEINPIAKTPIAPYYAVIFTNIRTELEEGYSEMAAKMEELASKQPGYLGHESVRQGLGITISYWESPEAIHHWKMNSDHILAQSFGREKWYSAYKTRICKVERDYGFEQI